MLRLSVSISDTVQNDLVRRVLDEVSEHTVALMIQHIFKSLKTTKSPTACFTDRTIRDKTSYK